MQPAPLLTQSMTCARDIMRTAVATVAPGDSLARALELMKHFAVRELAVVEEGVLVGILARSDLDPHLGHFEWTAVRIAMTAQPRAIAPDAPLDDVARALRAGSFNAVPVVEDGALVGMVSRHDCLRVVADT
jgi:tRNA nucleotidyltransferase (CCA-adding enzyme)